MQIDSEGRLSSYVQAFSHVIVLPPDGHSERDLVEIFFSKNLLLE